MEDQYYQKLLGDRLRNYQVEAEITELSAQIQEWEEEQRRLQQEAEEQERLRVLRE